MIPPVPVRPRASVAETLAVYLRPRVLIVLFLGFSAGLPLALSGSTLQVWMTQSGVDIKTIGLFAAVGTPYTIKFLWAPIVDALDVPLLARLLGRRRGWLLLSQCLLVVSIVLLGFCDPSAAPWLVALAALLVATASATQDIVIDAFRVESLPESEQAAGMASYVAAYRIGMLVSTAGALFLVTRFEVMGFGKNASWTAGYIAMAGFVVIGMVATLIALLGPISGAHFNPAVSLVRAVQRRLSWGEAGAYVVIQVTGCCLGTILAHAMFELPLVQSSLHIRSGSAQWLAEGVATCGLLCVVLGHRRAEDAPWMVAACSPIWGIPLKSLTSAWSKSSNRSNPLCTNASACSRVIPGMAASDSTASATFSSKPFVTTTSGSTSTCHPVSLDVNLAFWPRFPIASDN